MTLLLTGDVMLGRGIDQIQRRSVDPRLHEPWVKSALTYVELAEREHGPLPRRVAPEYVWGEALAVLDELAPQVRVVNLETAVTDGGSAWPGKGIHYRTHPANAAILQAAGIDVAVLANNHVLDWGREGLVETLATLRLAGLAPAGAGEDLEAAAAPAAAAFDGGRVLVFGVAHESSGVPPDWAADPGRPGVLRLPDLSRQSALELGEQVRRHRRPGHLVVVSVHWGDNWGYAVPEAQRAFARTLVEEAGVDVVHGHSSHHPKGLEVHQGRLILYGAGDLINDYEGIGGREEYRPELALLWFPELAPDGRLRGMMLAPVRVRRFRLERAPQAAEWLRDLLARESRGARFAVAEGMIRVTPAP